jgi:hypothetical protein
MADTAQDPSQDQEFLKAPPARQHAYLMSADEDYAKSTPNRQQAYLDHVNGTHYTETGGTNVPDAPLPPDPVQAARPFGKAAHGGGTLPERQALYKEAGGPLGVPLVAGARALEGYANREDLEELQNAARGIVPQTPIPDEAGIAAPSPTMPKDTRSARFLARSGADALRLGAGFLTPKSLAMAAVAPIGLGRLVVGAEMARENAPALVRNAPGMLRGEPEATKNTLNAAAGLTAAGALGSAEIAEGAPGLKQAGKMASAPYRMIVKGEPPAMFVPKAPEAMRQAIQPGVRVPKAEESISIGGQRLQQIRQAQNIQIPEKGPEAMKAVMDLNREAKVQILGAIEDRMGPVAQLKPSTIDVAKAIRNSVDDITLEREPGAREAVERAVGIYEKEGGNAWTLRQMENRMHTLNNRLANIYSQVTPGEARVPVEAEIALAEAKALRTRIDEAVKTLSGSGVKELKREYGAQRDIEKSLARQYAVATRQKGATLWEGLAALRIAGDFTSPTALAVGTTGRMLKTLRDPGFLLNKAFQGPEAFSASPQIAKPPGVKIAGLLPQETGPRGVNDPTAGKQAGTRPGTTEGGIRIQPNATRILTPEREGDASKMASTLKPIFGRVEPEPPGVKIAGLLPQETGPRGVNDPTAGKQAGTRPGTTEGGIKIQPNATRILTPEREGDASKMASTLKPIFGRVENVPGAPGSAPPTPEPPPTLSKPPEKPNLPTLTKKGTAKAGALDPVKELQDLTIQMRDLDKKISGTKSAYTQKPMIARYRKLEARANELSPQRSEGGIGVSGEAEGVPRPGVGGATKTPAPVMKRDIPTIEEYEDKLRAGGMGAAEAYKKANDDIKAVSGEYTLPDAIAREARKRIEQTMSGEKPSLFRAKETPAKQNAPTLKPTSKAEQLKTYNSLTDEQRQAVDAQFEHLPHMPQLLREGRMQQLDKHGPAGTYLKERLARELLEDAKKPGREPGED